MSLVWLQWNSWPTKNSISRCSTNSPKILSVENSENSHGWIVSSNILTIWYWLVWWFLARRYVVFKTGYIQTYKYSTVTITNRNRIRNLWLTLDSIQQKFTSLSKTWPLEEHTKVHHKFTKQVWSSIFEMHDKLRLFSFCLPLELGVLPSKPLTPTPYALLVLTGVRR